MADIIEITDFSAPELDMFARLTEAQLRSRAEQEKGIFIAESPKVIGYALDAGYEPLALLMERRHISGQGADLIARCVGVPVYTADRELLADLTGFELTRGILCAMRRPSLPAIEEVCHSARRIAILEGIVDSTNIGAIFRSAAALNVDALLLAPNCCDPLYRRAVRVSMGTVFQIPWARIPSGEWPESTLSRLCAMGFKSVAMALNDTSVPIDDAHLVSEPRLAIILGSEGNGLSAATISLCDYVALIPMSHQVDSLNVAAASAVAFWELCKERTGGTKGTRLP